VHEIMQMRSGQWEKTAQAPIGAGAVGAGEAAAAGAPIRKEPRRASICYLNPISTSRRMAQEWRLRSPAADENLRIAESAQQPNHDREQGYPGPQRGRAGA
jgi:hypothetical protein